MKEASIMLTSWGVAQYINLWTLVHLLGGVALGYLLKNIGLSTTISFVTIGIVFLGWEVYEKLAHLPEPWTNSIIDLIVGFVGIYVARLLPLFLSASKSWVLAVTLLVIWGLFNFLGWKASRAKEARMVAEKNDIM